MQGTIMSFKRSRRVTHNNQMIIHVEGFNSKEDAKKLVGKKAVWKSPAGKEITGEIRAPHGNSGAIRILFETGMPGQSLSQKVEIN
ncbi:MAG: 50S ribosomal protein L35ae [Candidatus Woesearchaeota archaeon]|nr:50S ribosomal protein L35ae [Candidatus Woesearchaeota archaeon]